MENVFAEQQSIIKQISFCPIIDIENRDIKRAIANTIKYNCGNCKFFNGFQWWDSGIFFKCTGPCKACKESPNMGQALFTRYDFPESSSLDEEVEVITECSTIKI